MRDFKIYLFIATGLLIFYIVSQYNRPKPVDWSNTVSDADKIPFGTYIIYHQLNDIFPGSKVRAFREPIYNVVTDHGIKKATYVIICGSLDMNEYDYTKLTKFVKDGNEVFISSQGFGEQFRKKLKTTTEVEYKGNIDSKFLSKSLDTAYSYVFEKDICDQYFNSVDTDKAIILGKNNLGHCNFIKYPMGKGALYLNADPLLFSNYSLLKPQGAKYAANALSYLKKNDTVLWDEYYTQGRAGEDNSMRVFLRHAGLKWAFYIAFFSLIVFVFYEMKRRQRIIPIIEPLKNSTLEFVNVVGQVYYEQHNSLNIAQKKILFFLENLRSKHNLKTNPLDVDFIERLSQKTGVEYTFAQDLVNHINYIELQQQITDRDLTLLNQLIEQFYNQSK
jgi:hypothetical protein